MSSKASTSSSKASKGSSSTSKVLIKPSDLASLEGNDLIIFEVNERTPTEHFMYVLRQIARACTGRVEAPTSINDIPVTTTGDGVYVIEMRGKYDGFEFNKERLMGAKGSNYFVAVFRGDKKNREKKNWHEVCKSEKPIEGAQPLGFHGSYTEYSRTGLRNETMKVGFGALMWSLMSLFNGNNCRYEFLTVCANLFEPARYPIIGRQIIQFPNFYCHISPSFIELIYGWDTLSGLVIDCQGDEKIKLEFNVTKMTVQVYGDAGVLENMTVTTINRGNVHKILGMAKCKPTVECDT